MVFALLGSAILWNVGTWYLGLPASSSHTLIGSIIGVGITHSLMTGEGLAEGVNWSKLGETMMALLLSPVIGFTAAGLLLLLARLVFRNPVLHRPASETKAPPLAVRAVLIATCTGVSFTHGSNDGQKGMGLIMLVLIALAPAAFALQLDTPPEHLRAIVEALAPGRADPACPGRAGRSTRRRRSSVSTTMPTPAGSTPMSCRRWR